MDTSCNGWKNYETWRVNMEIFGDWSEDDYPEVEEGETHGEYTERLAAYLEQLAFELIEGESTGIARDYATAFLNGVRWDEIAEHMADNSEHDWIVETEAALDRELMGV